MFNPDADSDGRDFPCGGAREYFHSIERLLSFSPETIFFAGYGYPPSNENTARDPLLYYMVGEQ